MSFEQLRQRFNNADPHFGPVPFWWWSAEEITEERVCWQLRKFRQGGLRNIGIMNIAPTGPQYGSVSDNPAYFSERWWKMFEVALHEAERLEMRLWFYDQIGFSGANLPARIVTEHPEYAGYHLSRFTGDEQLPEGAALLLETDDYRYAAVRQGFNWLDPEAAAVLIDRVHGEYERRFPHQLGKAIAGSFQDELPPLPLWTPQLPALYKDKYREELLPELPALFEERPSSGTVRRRVYKLAAELAEQSLFKPLKLWHEHRGMLICCDQAGPARRADVHGAQRLYLDYFRTHRWYNAAGSDMDGDSKAHSSMVHLHGGKRVFLEAFHTSGWGGTLEETMHWLVPWLQAGVTLYSPHSVYYSTRGGWWEWAPPDTGWRQPYFGHYPLFADTISRVCSLLSEGTHVADIAVHYPAYAAQGYMSLEDGKRSEHPMRTANRMPNESLNRLQEAYQRLTGQWSRREQSGQGVLREAGLDFDIADDSALEKAVVDVGGKKLRIGDERFSVLLLCGTSMMDEEARLNVEAWVRQGGWVIGIDVPEDDPLFAGEGVHYVKTPEEAVRLLERRLPRHVEGKGLALHRRTEEADIFLLLPDNGNLLAMHQPASPDTALQESAVYRLRTSGVPQAWDPVSGETAPLPYTRDGEWIELEVSFTAWPAALIVCPSTAEAAVSDTAVSDVAADPIASAASNADGEGFCQDKPPEFTKETGEHGSGAHAFPAMVEQLPLHGDRREINSWQVTAVPALDNRYGDFDLHGERAPIVPIERRSVKVCREDGQSDGNTAGNSGRSSDRNKAESIHSGIEAGWHLGEFDDASWPERLWSEAPYWLACKGEAFDQGQSWQVVYSHTFGDLRFRSWAGRMGRVPRRFLNLGEAAQGETVWAKTYVLAPEDGRYWIRTESNARINGWIGGEEIGWQGGPEEQTAWVQLQEGSNELLLRAEAAANGLIRAGVEVNREARAALPKWIYVQNPHPKSQLVKHFVNDSVAAVQQVRILFAARGRAALYVNGAKVTEHGDFNPYIRQGQEEIDVTSLWRKGRNEIRFELPEGKGEVLADGVVELADGEKLLFCTGEDWQDEQGGKPAVLHKAVLQFAETETLWLTPRPHPLPDIGWLMPESVPEPQPLPFHCYPEQLGRPIWFRFPMPAGAISMNIACRGKAKVWIDGQEVAVDDGFAAFPPQRAGVMASVRIEPSGPCTDADVLLAPIRFETAPVPGQLGDWRTALCLPHHSGAVEYETVIELRGSGRAVLDLGHVRGTAEVWLDGKPLGVRLWRPYRFELGRELPRGGYRLRVRVTNTLGAHYEIGRPTVNVGGDPSIAYWSRKVDGNWQRIFAAGGLFGPVLLYES